MTDRSDPPMADPRRHAPATLRNRDAILAVLKEVLPDHGVLLEIAIGSGEHAAFMAPRLALIWQPSDYEAAALPSIDAHARATGAANIRPALQLDVTAAIWPVTDCDALLCCNMIHIAPWAAAEGLVAGAARLLSESGAPLVLYGPFKRDGVHTTPSNAAFDADLQARDARWGVRCLDTEVTPLAARHGFRRDRIVEMPANNLTVIFRKV